MAYRDPPRPGQCRIALVHAIPVSIQPIQEAFATLWPDAWTFNLLEDSLIAGQREAGGFTPAFNARVLSLCRYCMDTGAEAILFTGSAFGPAVDAAKKELPIPVLKPYEAMVAEALKLGDRLGIVATFGPTIPLLKEDIEATAGRTLEIHTAEATGGLEALEGGDGVEHDMLVAAAARTLPDCDAILLAQYSAARAAPMIHHKHVLTPTGSAVLHLQKLLG